MTKTDTDLDAPLAYDCTALLGALDRAIAGADEAIKELAKRAAKFRAQRRKLEAVVKTPGPDRRVVYQQKRIAKGICSKCGNEKICRARSTRFGKECLDEMIRVREAKALQG